MVGQVSSYSLKAANQLHYVYEYAHKRCKQFKHQDIEVKQVPRNSNINWIGQVRLSATVTCNQYYLLPCGADGAR